MKKWILISLAVLIFSIQISPAKAVAPGDEFCKSAGYSGGYAVNNCNECSFTGCRISQYCTGHVDSAVKSCCYNYAPQGTACGACDTTPKCSGDLQQSCQYTQSTSDCNGQGSCCHDTIYCTGGVDCTNYSTCTSCTYGCDSTTGKCKSLPPKPCNKILSQSECSSRSDCEICSDNTCKDKGTCPKPQCSDNIDNDGDGFKDYGAGGCAQGFDPSCTSSNDNDESPKDTCSVCSDTDPGNDIFKYGVCTTASGTKFADYCTTSSGYNYVNQYNCVGELCGSPFTTACSGANSFCCDGKCQSTACAGVNCPTIPEADCTLAKTDNQCYWCNSESACKSKGAVCDKCKKYKTSGVPLANWETYAVCNPGDEGGCMNDPDCMWCTGSTTSPCTSGTCSQAPPSGGLCGSSSCSSGSTVIIDMMNGNQIKECMQYDNEKWYTVKGALGENVTFTFTASNCKPSAYLFYTDKGCGNASLNRCTGDGAGNCCSYEVNITPQSSF